MDDSTDIFLQLIENHKGIIFKIARSYCKEVEDRQDLVQEIIIQLWQSHGKYDSQFKLSTWVYRVALNTAISFYRKNKIRVESSVELSAIFESSLQADESFEEDPNLVALQAFIQELRDFDKALILLYLDGLSQKEIAEVSGISPTNVGTKLSRIKKALQQKFQTFQSP